MGMYNNAENSGIINVYEQMLGNLPLKSYRAGEIALAAGAQTGQLLVLKKGRGCDR